VTQKRKANKTMIQKILALDVATKTGFCTETASGVWDFNLKRDESSGMRLIRFKSKLKELIALEEISLIVFERSQGMHQNAVITQSELHGCLKLYCEENKIEYRAFSPGEIKKFATGKGNANKDAMIKAVVEKYGKTPKDDNEADAIHLFHLAKDFYN
jgi:Holliday junction resolvasome RuvABC endonuclease subunit